MRDSAVFTTAMSSISIAVAAQTTTSVQRWIVMGWGSGEGEERGGIRFRIPAPHGLSHRGEPQWRTLNRRP